MIPRNWGGFVSKFKKYLKFNFVFSLQNHADFCAINYKMAATREIQAILVTLLLRYDYKGIMMKGRKFNDEKKSFRGIL